MAFEDDAFERMHKIMTDGKSAMMENMRRPQTRIYSIAAKKCRSIGSRLSTAMRSRLAGLEM